MRSSTLLIAVLSGLIAVLAILLAIGCGSGDDNGDSGASSQDAAQTADSSPATDSQSGDSSDGADSGSADSGDSEAGDSDSAESGDGGAQASGEPLSKAAFVKQGDAICTAVPNGYQARLKKLEEEKKAAKEPKPAPPEIAAKASVPPLYTAVTKFELMVPPSGDEAEAEAIVAALEKAAQGLEANPEAEFSGPKSPFAEFQALTKKYGFKACSQL